MALDQAATVYRAAFPARLLVASTDYHRLAGGDLGNAEILEKEAHTIRLHKPEIPDILTDVQDMNAHIAESFLHNDDLDHCHFHSGILECGNLHKRRIEFSHCVFERCSFAPFDDIIFSFVDVHFLSCDFSNLNFHNSSFLRVSFSQCKAVGINFSEVSLRDISVDQSVFHYARFFRVKFDSVILQESDFSSSIFEECKWKSLLLKESNFQASSFTATALKGLDFRSCAINGLAASIYDLKGAIITSPQAMELVGLLGVVIKN